MEQRNNIGVIILAGGKSSRMGQDKGLMPLNGKPMVQHVIDAAKTISPDIILISNNAQYRQFGLPVFQDEWTEKGPLAGIYTGLRNTSNGVNLVLSCDIPFVGTALLRHLVAAHGANDITIFGTEEKLHPLIGIYTTACLPVIEKKLRENQLKVTGIFEHLSVRILPDNGFLPQNFRNINSPEDL